MKKKENKTDWATLPLGKFLKLWELSKDKGLDGLERTARTLAVLHDITEAEVMAWPILEFSDAAKGLAWMAEPLPKPYAVADAVEVNGREYRVTRAEEMVAAQYIDFQGYASDEANDRSREILATLLVPVGKDGKPKKYGTDYDIRDVVADVETMPYGLATSLLAFFLRSSGKSIRRIASSWMGELKRARKTAAKESGRQPISANGAG